MWLMSSWRFIFQDIAVEQLYSTVQQQSALVFEIFANYLLSISTFHEIHDQKKISVPSICYSQVILRHSARKRKIFVHRIWFIIKVVPWVPKLHHQIE